MSWFNHGDLGFGRLLDDCTRDKKKQLGINISLIKDSMDTLGLFLFLFLFLSLSFLFLLLVSFSYIFSKKTLCEFIRVPFLPFYCEIVDYFLIRVRIFAAYSHVVLQSFSHEQIYLCSLFGRGF